MSTTLRVLIIGAGGRDHALAWKFSQSPLLGELHVAPGNAVLADLATCYPLLELNDLDGFVALAEQLQPDLVVIGSEDHLVAGLASRMQAAGFNCLGPTRVAAQLEASKAFSKQLMGELGISTATWHSHTTLAAAVADVATRRGGVAVKADGLAAGCGTFICHTPEDAEAALNTLFEHGARDNACEVIVEDLLEGFEVSVMALTDGTNVVPLPAARDYKRLGTGDTGPNTGGMGAHCPSSDVSAETTVELVASTITPVVQEMARRGTPFRGVVYAGIMMTADGPFVLEYNSRFGNPETQALVRVLDADLLDLVNRAAGGSLEGIPAVGAKGVAVAICVACENYPALQLERLPVPISGIDTTQDRPDIVTFAGYLKRGNAPASLMALGGRAVTVTAHGETYIDAIAAGYNAVDAIRLSGSYFRTDIGAPTLALA